MSALSRREFRIGMAVTAGIAGSVVVVLLFGTRTTVVLESAATGYLLQGAAVFVVYLFALTALVRAFREGDLPISFSTSGAGYAEAARVGAKTEEQIRRLNSRLDDQANLLEAALREIDRRLNQLESGEF
jgi:hypothetical protein